MQKRETFKYISDSLTYMKEIKIYLDDEEHAYHKRKKGIWTWKDYLFNRP